MLFDLRQFEQFFKERILKKGLKLFEKGDLEFIERKAGLEYIFEAGVFRLALKKKGDKLLNYTCSCAKKEYCEHFAAALFYFQQEALGISVKNKIRVRKNSGLKINGTSKIEEVLRKNENDSLVKFIREHKYGLSAPELLSFLSDKSTITLFDVYEFQIGVLLEPYLLMNKLDGYSIEAITKSMYAFVKNSKAHFKKPDNLLYLDLALVCSFSPLFSLRFSEDETGLFEIYHKAISNLEKMYTSGLSKEGRQAWVAATLRSVKSNKNLFSEAFMFFVPRMVSDSKSESDLHLLSDTLGKRSYKVPYSHTFDKLLIPRLQVALREWKLFKAPFPMQVDGTEVELILAKAELDFCKNKYDRAFKLLEEEYERVKTEFKNYYYDYLDYIITKARTFGKKEIELKYLKESFIRRLFIVADDLDRYIHLVSPERRGEELAGLIARIKTNTNAYYFDKISILLLKADLLDDLIIELYQQNNKFTLVHDIALKKFPDYSERFLSLYMRHLSETLKQDSIYSYQVKVFNTAKVFLDKLPEKLVIELIKKLLDQIGKTGHLYRYINELYDYPFLKDGENYY